MSSIYMRASRIDGEREIGLGSNEGMTIRLFIGTSNQDKEEILTVSIEEGKKGHYFLSADGRAATEMGASGNLNISVKAVKEDNK